MCLMKYCLLHKLRHPFTPMFYFFLTYSYRSYLSFGRTVGDYWPRHSAATPPMEKKILDMLGEKNSGEWGIYNEKTCVIMDKTKGERGRLAMTLSEPTAITNTIEFFFKLDPGYRQGDCLCVLCNIGWTTVATGLWNIFGRLRSGGFKRSSRKKEKRSVVFGKAQRGCDKEVSPGVFEEFSVSVSPLDLSFLQDKLMLSLRSETPISEDSDYIREVLTYWEREFDWEAQEGWLNQFPQYRFKCSRGTWIHFVHVQSESPGALPLLLLHGFPSTMVEFFKVIKALAAPEDDSDPAFNVVAVSMPGCGFSESLGSNTDTAEIATVCAELMNSMDYMIYAAHGSGIGGVVASQIGTLFPESCVAVHLGTPIPDVKSMSDSIWEKVKSSLQFAIPSAFFSKPEVRQMNNFTIREYWENMSVDLKWTYAVASDALALTAFFIQKLRNTTDCRGDIEAVFSKDELITFISLYWFSRSINSAIHVYHNNSVNLLRTSFPFDPVEIPVGVTIYPAQQTLPKYFSRNLYRNVQDWRYMKRGGYFPAWEDPNAFVESIRMFFSSMCAPPSP
eukprot:TRINITY_DN3015_c0_g1_i2.p1 TRINITY_DN3015_c0_g1~~TRINITY_DN3015_c0_g1_i2.p1  ORF type:complete len:561 (-),score=87.90 TRINITY_DN3015_c0_g1_i2:54-1736(-)